jgi:hypothetical protein
MPMQELYALLQGKIAPQAVDLAQLIQLARQYNSAQLPEYEVIDLATNFLLDSYLKQAQEYL